MSRPSAPADDSDDDFKDAKDAYMSESDNEDGRSSSHMSWADAKEYNTQSESEGEEGYGSSGRWADANTYIMQSDSESEDESNIARMRAGRGIAALPPRGGRRRAAFLPMSGSQILGSGGLGLGGTVPRPVDGKLAGIGAASSSSLSLPSALGFVAPGQSAPVVDRSVLPGQASSPGPSLPPTPHSSLTDIGTTQNGNETATRTVSAQAGSASASSADRIQHRQGEGNVGSLEAATVPEGSLPVDNESEEIHLGRNDAGVDEFAELSLDGEDHPAPSAAVTEFAASLDQPMPSAPVSAAEEERSSTQFGMGTRPGHEEASPHLPNSDRVLVKTTPISISEACPSPTPPSAPPTPALTPVGSPVDLVEARSGFPSEQVVAATPLSRAASEKASRGMKSRSSSLKGMASAQVPGRDERNTNGTVGASSENKEQEQDYAILEDETGAGCFPICNVIGSMFEKLVKA
eukprot:TRINITY_DN26224_c0_g1_i1.p1 TRINITY_DN26224_c0_g1~~TRINITY_DN26224_c0_g1_i1.p1  ORF type:complete len:463 (-),score=65.00 TRINITY_DN26224_c0_g1_i1:546-1934(-)